MAKNIQKTHERTDRIDARTIAYRAICCVEEKGAPLSDSLDAEFQKHKDIKSADKAFAWSIAHTYFRHLGHLNALLRHYLKQPLPAKAKEAKRWLRMGLCEIVFLQVAPHAVVNEVVGAVSRLKDGANSSKKGLVNAILRRAAESREKHQKHAMTRPAEALPAWIKSRWEKQFGKEGLANIAKEILSQAPLDITCYDAKISGKLIDAYKTASIAPATTRLYEAPKVENISGFRNGQWWVQDWAATIPVTLLGDVKNQTVADLCAAPGGKTMQLAALGAIVTAVDSSRKRMRRLEENLKRTRLNAKIIVANATTLQANEFDMVMLDAPCSATGTLRRHPELAWIKNEASLASLKSIQKALLDNAATLLKSGGKLIYCVCSLEPEEGREQIAGFLSHHSDFRRFIPEKNVIGDQALTKEGDILLRPDFLKDKGGNDGFFISILQKATPE